MPMPRPWGRAVLTMLAQQRGYRARGKSLLFLNLYWRAAPQLWLGCLQNSGHEPLSHP